MISQISDFGMKRRALKDKEEFLFGNLNFFVKDLQILMIVSSLTLRSGYYIIHVVFSILLQMIVLQ